MKNPSASGGRVVGVGASLVADRRVGISAGLDQEPPGRLDIGGRLAQCRTVGGRKSLEFRERVRLAVRARQLHGLLGQRRQLRIHPSDGFFPLGTLGGQPDERRFRPRNFPGNSQLELPQRLSALARGGSLDLSEGGLDDVVAERPRARHLPAWGCGPLRCAFLGWPVVDGFRSGGRRATERAGGAPRGRLGARDFLAGNRGVGQAASPGRLVFGRFGSGGRRHVKRMRGKLGHGLIDRLQGRCVATARQRDHTGQRQQTC